MKPETVFTRAATGACPETDESSPPSHPVSLISSHLRLVLPSGLFPLGFPIKILFTFLTCFMRSTYPGHLVLLYLITLTEYDEALHCAALSSRLPLPSSYLLTY